MDTSEWRRLIKFLRTEFPIDAPIKVVRIPLKRNSATTIFNGSSFRITISSELSTEAMADALIHEFAHVLCLSEAYQHGENWSKFYGRIYSKYEQEFC
jgi:hypothetical protein